MILVERPKDAIWAQLVRNEEYPEFMPHSVASKTYFERGNEKGLAEEIRVFLMSIKFHVIHTFDEPRGIIAWRLDHNQPNDIKNTTGSWLIRPHGDNACILVYSASIESGINFPRFIENFFMNKDLPEMVKSVKRRVEGR